MRRHVPDGAEDDEPRHRPGRQIYHRKPKCRICNREVDFGDLCYYCRKRKTG